MNASEELRRAIDQAERHATAPALLKKVANENDHDDLAEVAAAVEATVREECQERDLNKHVGIGVLYLVVDRLAEVDDG